MQGRFLFPCQLYLDYLDINNSELESYAYSLMNNSKGRNLTNKGGWQSEFVDTKQEMQELVDTINNKLEMLREVYKFKDKHVLKVESMWININFPNSYNSRHTHPDSYISGTYYVRVPENKTLMVSFLLNCLKN